MSIIKLFYFNICFLIFPITLYIVFIDFKNSFKPNEKEKYIELILYTTMYLMLSMYSELYLQHYIIILTIPILLCFIFNKTYTSIIISIILSLFYYEIISKTIYPVILLFTTYQLINLYYKRRTTSKYQLSLLFIIATLICGLLFFKKSISFSIIALFIITIFLLDFIIQKLNSTLKTYLTLNELNKDTTMLKIIHELKNPLFVIRGYLSLNNDLNNYKDILSLETENTLNILEDLRDLKYLKTNKTTFNIKTLINEINKTIIPFFKDSNVKYISTKEKDIFIYADYNRIKQVLINIIKNSLEALNKNGTLELNYYKHYNELIIKIKDNGKGMSKKELDKLFIPFNTNKEHGTGLGLCLSKEIIDSHNGKLIYKSVKNHYTIAYIHLPINNMDMDSNMV